MTRTAKSSATLSRARKVDASFIPRKGISPIRICRATMKKHATSVMCISLFSRFVPRDVSQRHTLPIIQHIGGRAVPRREHSSPAFLSSLCHKRAFSILVNVTEKAQEYCAFVGCARKLRFFATYQCAIPLLGLAVLPPRLAQPLAEQLEVALEQIHPCRVA